MRKAKKLIILLSVIGVVLVLSAAFGVRQIHKRSDYKLSLLLENLKEGMPYTQAEKILGKPDRTLTSPASVKEWRTIKDSKITQECNLHMFGRMDLVPHKYILIYEDKENHTVRFVTVISM